MDVVIMGTKGQVVQYDDIKRITEREKDVIMLDSNGQIHSAEKSAIITIEITTN